MQDESTCGICQESINDKTSLNSCSHLFCFKCIARWSQESNSCPLCQARFTELRPCVVRVKNIDRREENWMEVMEQYDSEEQSVDSDEDDGSEADVYEEDFAVPDGVVVYEDGTIVDERDEEDYVPNEFVKDHPKQKDSTIVLKDGKVITVPFHKKPKNTFVEENEEEDEDAEFVMPSSKNDEEDDDDEDMDEDEDISSLEDSDDSSEIETRGRVLYKPPPRAAKQGNKRYAE